MLPLPGGRLHCPKCQRDMTNLGNVSGGVCYTVPPQWQEVHVCHCCKVRTSIWVRDPEPVAKMVENYEEIPLPKQGS